MALHPQQLIALINNLSTGKPLWLAYSGGVDSHVLLDILSQAEKAVRDRCCVVHVDHGLNPHSQQWSQHCAQISANYGFKFHCLTVEVDQQDKLGLEAAARQARYQALSELLPEDAVLVTAQHQQDQAETILLQLLRGAGPKGLSAMASSSERFGMKVIRPLLMTTKADVLAYAQQRGLSWIDDPSNSDTQINRNYIRHQVFPLLESRWPAMARTLSRSAEHCAETTELVEVLAKQDLQLIRTENEQNAVVIDALLALSPARQRNVLRYLIQLLQLPLPSAVILQRILDEVCTATADAMPLVAWHGGEARRFQQQLYFLPPVQPVAENFAVNLKGPESVTLPTGTILTWQTVETGIPESWLSELTLCFRHGGERIQLAGSHHHSQLKHLMQQWQIPTWQRSQIPLLFRQQELIAVVGFALAESCNKNNMERQWLPILQSHV